MDEFSFDPRSWRKKDGKTPDPADAAQPGAAGDSTEADSTAQGEESLPEVWRGIGTSFVPGAPSPPSSPPARNAARFARPASVAILAAAFALAWVTRAPPPQDTGGTAGQVAREPGASERSLMLGNADEIAPALETFGVAKDDAVSAALAATAILSRPGEVRLKAVLVPRGKGIALERFQVSYPDGAGAVVSRNEDGAFVASAVAAELTNSIRFLPGEIDNESFYSSAVSAGVPDTLVAEFINAFGYDFNLASEVTPGDTFEVAYEQAQNAEGDAVGQPELLYAKLTTAEKSLAIYRFKRPDGEVGWYDGNGATTKRGFMRTPVDGARITSNFGMRFHPTLHYNRLHAGVDFAVPVGTPVYAAAAGTVIGATPTGCGGNMAVLQHDNGWVTRYFHLSKYAPGLHEGERVEQGFTIGLSGTTGTCTTGPHLHYELRIDGEPVDPLGVPMDEAKRQRLEGTALAAFIEQRNRIDVARAKQGI